MYYLRFNLTNGSTTLITSKDTDIVIEGPPRTANTFMVEAFKNTQNVTYKIAHHIHSPAQLLRAKEYSIPAIILIREPVASSISHSIAVWNNGLESVVEALHFYIDFYSPLLKHKDYFVVADFDQTINRPDLVINELNRKFNTDFMNYINYNSETGDLIKQKIEDSFYLHSVNKDLPWFGDGGIDEKRVSRPSDRRKQIKEGLIKELENSKFINLVSEAESIYNRFIT